MEPKTTTDSAYYRIKLICMDIIKGEQVWTETLLESRYPTPEAAMREAEALMAGRPDIRFAYAARCYETRSE